MRTTKILGAMGILLVASGTATANAQAVKAAFTPRFASDTSATLRSAFQLVAAKKYPPALGSLLKASWAGETSAYAWVGYMYENGLGAPRNDALAASWYRKAADAGDPAGMTKLGMLYDLGHGVTQDHAEAVKWFRKAAEAGSRKGMYLLGQHYEFGQGVLRDYSAADAWYRKAADAGDADGMSSTGRTYYEGRGTSKDFARAAEWFERAANGGSARGMFNLGVMYETGHGFRQSYSRAAQWYRKATDGGDWAGMSGLGKLYDQGLGVPRDTALAHRLYLEAGTLLLGLSPYVEAGSSYEGVFDGRGSAMGTANRLIATRTQLTWLQDDGGSQAKCVLSRSFPAGTSFSVKSPGWSCTDGPITEENSLSYDASNDRWIILDGTPPSQETMILTRTR